MLQCNVFLIYLVGSELLSSMTLSPFISNFLLNLWKQSLFNQPIFEAFLSKLLHESSFGEDPKYLYTDRISHAENGMPNARSSPKHPNSTLIKRLYGRVETSFFVHTPSLLRGNWAWAWLSDVWVRPSHTPVRKIHASAPWPLTPLLPGRAHNGVLSAGPLDAPGW